VDIFNCTEAAKCHPSEQIILHMMHLPVFCKDSHQSLQGCSIHLLRAFVQPAPMPQATIN
jgi:hypothetical protein